MSSSDDELVIPISAIDPMIERAEKKVEEAQRELDVLRDMKKWLESLPSVSPKQDEQEKHDQEKLARLSLHPLSTDDALSAAMQICPHVG